MENISDQLLPKLIGLKSNEIQDMKTAVSDGNQSIYVTMVRKRPECCPKCGCIDHVVSNGYYQRKILTSSEILEGDALYLKLPRWYCEDCHSSFSQEQCLAPQGNRISYATVMKAMELLKDPHITFEDAGDLCKVSPSSAICPLSLFLKRCASMRSIRRAAFHHQSYAHGTKTIKDTLVPFMISVGTGLSMPFLLGLRTTCIITFSRIKAQDA